RIARRARGDHPHPVRTQRDAVGPDRLGVFAQRTERAFQCFGGKGPGLVHVLSQAHDLHPPVGVHDLHLVTVDVYDVGDQQPDRVGPTVDRRDTAHGRFPLFSSESSWSSTHTHGPLSHQGPSSAKVSAPNGLAPGTANSWATRACKHLTRVGIPPVLCIPSGSGSTPSTRACSVRSAR